MAKRKDYEGESVYYTCLKILLVNFEQNVNRLWTYKTKINRK